MSLPNNLYAYLETLLNYNAHAKKSHFTSSLQYDDTPGNFDAAPDISGVNANKGLVKRQEFTLGGKVYALIGHIHSDIFSQEKMLLNGVEMRVRLLHIKDAFCLMDSLDDGKFSIKIKEPH